VHWWYGYKRVVAQLDLGNISEILGVFLAVLINNQVVNVV